MVTHSKTLHSWSMSDWPQKRGLEKTQNMKKIGRHFQHRTKTFPTIENADDELHYHFKTSPPGEEFCKDAATAPEVNCGAVSVLKENFWGTIPQRNNLAETSTLFSVSKTRKITVERKEGVVFPQNLPQRSRPSGNHTPVPVQSLLVSPGLRLSPARFVASGHDGLYGWSGGNPLPSESATSGPAQRCNKDRFQASAKRKTVSYFPR